MNVFEELVLDYCSAPPGRFVAPEYSVPYRESTGGSQPDLVVLDFPTETIYVVEVTTASNLRPILSRLAERESRWFAHLRSYLAELHEPFSRWRLRATVFVRDEIHQKLSEKVEGYSDVSVISMDAIVFSWRWRWDGQIPRNPLE